jgi:hypothetical protein
MAPRHEISHRAGEFMSPRCETSGRAGEFTASHHEISRRAGDFTAALIFPFPARKHRLPARHRRFYPDARANPAHALKAARFLSDVL